MYHRGKLAILIIVLVAIGLGMLSWYWRYTSGRQSLDAWGPTAAQLIRHASQVEILQLERASTGEFSVGGENYQVVAQKDISRARGLVHYRHALIDDTTFDWGAKSSARGKNWSWALRFTEGDRQAVVAFDFESQVVCGTSGRPVMALRPSTVEAFKEYFGRQFESNDMGSS